jgi:hypothetical protein
MLNIADRVLEISTTEGLGAYNLDGPGTGYQTFVAGVGDGAEVWYVATDNTSWEIGVGTITDGAPDLLSRDTILESTNSGDAVSWTVGTKYIFATTPAAVVQKMEMVFDTLADLDTSPILYPGLRVRILGRHTKGDPGAMSYEIVAAATGTDNGGDYIDLATSGLQAQALFPNQDINVWHFGGGTGVGATDDAALAALNASLIASHAHMLHSGVSRGYINNVSNAANTTSVSGGVDTTLPMNGDGTNNFISSNVATGKAEFLEAFNGGNGGFILDNLNPDSDLKFRITFVNLGSVTTATVKVFLVFDKTVPGTGTKISTSPISVASNIEQAVELSAYHGGIEAAYVQIKSDTARDYQLNGVKITVDENS